VVRDVQKGKVDVMKGLIILVMLISVPVAALAGWEVAFFDDFNRPDGPVGAPWIVAGPDTLYISSGRVICPFDTSYGLIAYLHDEEGPNIALEMDFSFFGDTDGWYHAWIGGVTTGGDTVAYGAEMERDLFGLYFYPPESLIVEKPFAFQDYNVYSLRLAYYDPTGTVSLVVRDAYGVAADSIVVTGPGSDFSMVYVGIENRASDDQKWLDNVTMWLTAYSGVPKGPDTEGLSLELYSPSPNPCSGQTAISYALPVAGDVTISIYSTMGREVMTWYRPDASAGYHETRWDGTAYDGTPVAPGVYMCTVKAGGQVQSRKLVVTQ
jgi:hypothetical protein